MIIERQKFGPALAWVGSTLGAMGAIVNALLLHNEAFLLWGLSNPLLATWAFGDIKGWWHNGMSTRALFVMYVVFIVGNAYALWMVYGHKIMVIYQQI